MSKQCKLFSNCGCKFFSPSCTLTEQCIKLNRLLAGHDEAELVLIGNTVYKKVGNINNMG